MAGYPVASGVPSHHGNYTPTLFSKKLLVKYYLATVFGAIANTDYEGEIKDMGDTVEIRTVPDVAIRDYVKGQSLQYDHQNPGTVTLNIDKGKYYGVKIADLDRIQSDIPFQDKWATDASEQLKVAVDTTILAGMVDTAAATYNRGATAGKISANVNLGITGAPFALSKSNIIDYIVGMGQVLDEQNIPEHDRWLVLPAWAVARVKTSDLKDASMTGDGKSILRNGRVGMIDRFEVFMSNSLPHVTDTDECFYPYAGHKSGLTFASQFIKNEVIPNPDDFGDLMRGLQVFGYKVVKPDAIVQGYVKAA